MPNSLLTGVSGLLVNQEMLDVVGNNLANSNTVGFKEQRVRFGDLIYQTLNAGTSSTATTGGVNPIQIGLGAEVAAIDPNLQQGSLEATGRDLDVALQGNGFFVVNDGVQDHFTRAGAFGVDSLNNLVDPASGLRVQRYGSVGEASATSPAFQIAGDNDIKVPYGTGIPGKATSTITLQGNLSASALGPLVETLTSATPFKAGGATATNATLLNGLNDNTAPYGGTDKLQIQGTTASDAPVNFSLAVGPATTMGDLIAAINAHFTDSTAALDASGNLVLKANNTGPASLSLTIADAAGNAGAANWSLHNLQVTTVGKAGDTVTSGIQFFDSQGTAHTLSLVFQKASNNVWNLTGSIPSGDGVMTDNLVGSITFNDDGSFRQVAGTGLGDAMMTVRINGISVPQVIGFNFGTVNGFNGLTQVGGNSSAAATAQDGNAAGFLSSLSINQDGTINGIFTNGKTLPIAQLAIASFANPGGLDREGNNYYVLSSQSGPALIGSGLAGGRGSVQQKSLETSNVDVATEFTRLIIAQRGFQVNARTITVSDQVLQNLANIIQ